MLEGIVQEDNFGRFDPLLPKQVLIALNSVFVHRHHDSWKFLEILQRFIAQVLVCAILISLLEALCLSAVTSTQSGHTVIVFQQIDEVFRVWRFPRSAKVEVAHANYWLLELCGFQDVPIIKLMPDCQCDMVQK